MDRSSSRPKPPLSGSRFLKWAGHRLAQPLSSKLGNYVFLSPPFRQAQAVRNRKTGARLPYQVRSKSDLTIAKQMFLAEEYAIDQFSRAADIRAQYEVILASGQKPLIIDCGGNIGLASLYFKDQFPEARIVAVEPDHGNFALMKENISQSDVVAVNAAVGAAAGRGRVVDLGHGDCGLRVERDSDGDTLFVSIDGLISEHGDGAVPFLIKVDIEGFERELFAGPTEWLDRFYVAVIELHDWMMPRSGSSRAFLSAVAPLDRDFLFRGENVFSISNRLPGV